MIKSVLTDYDRESGRAVRLYNVVTASSCKSIIVVIMIIMGYRGSEPHLLSMFACEMVTITSMTLAIAVVRLHLSLPTIAAVSSALNQPQLQMTQKVEQG